MKAPRNKRIVNQFEAHTKPLDDEILEVLKNIKDAIQEGRSDSLESLRNACDTEGDFRVLT